MKKEAKLLVIIILMLSTNLYSQTYQNVEMADLLRQSGKIYTVVASVVLILTGMLFFLIRVDRRVSKLEKKLENHVAEDNTKS